MLPHARGNYRPLMEILWRDMFHLGLPVAEKMMRAVIIYGVLVVLVRVAGKRELAQLNPFDLVVLLTLSNTVQNAIIGDDNSILGGVIGASTLIGVNYLVVRFLYRHQRLDRLIEGDPATLVENGVVRMDRLGHELITLPELESAAHRQGFGSLDEVERAVIEPGGAIVFVGKKPTPETSRHEELMARIDQVLNEVRRLGLHPAGGAG